MKQLRARLWEQEMAKRRAEEEKLEATKSDINFGSQIRSYVLAPTASAWPYMGSLAASRQLDHRKFRCEVDFQRHLALCHSLASNLLLPDAGSPAGAANASILQTMAPKSRRLR